mgnify:CR=1 FL=1
MMKIWTGATMDKAIHPGTLAVWGGEAQFLMQGATQVPVVHSVSFGYKDLDEWIQVAQGEKPGHIYGRNTNPTVQAFEEKVRQMEGGDAATSAATGMGIISRASIILLNCYGNDSMPCPDGCLCPSHLHMPRHQDDCVTCSHKSPCRSYGPTSPPPHICAAADRAGTWNP